MKTSIQINIYTYIYIYSLIDEHTLIALSNVISCTSASSKKKVGVGMKRLDHTKDDKTSMTKNIIIRLVHTDTNEVRVALFAPYKLYWHASCSKIISTEQQII